ncbi:hypothetical protein ASF10_22650 [Flavobacterium sp. Leaf82]|uniref:DUF4062 domain-containing protein n=1 Tax=Flavobacterium sp. Leaf82 TaxID=1736238 RepID=UPI0006F6B8CB|nr:DUF4062 domain-containing protein [Flavobacterium sp. Leaf82]KQO29077.1 hypothetical protein ASF10_22650 [Flavobacterium sp. Leaf82]
MAKKLKIWLSATSLLEDDLGQIKAILPKEYEIIYSQDLILKSGNDFKINSHFEELEKCDLFLGIINAKVAQFSIGTDNIFLEEIKKAEDLKMPYWYLVHRDVTFTRNLLNDLVRSTSNEIQSKNKYFFDIRTIDIYDEILKQTADEIGYHPPLEFFRLDGLIKKFEETLYSEKNKENLNLMVASTVYGFEDQLSKIINDIEDNGFNIRNSFHGSIKVNPNLSNLNNCLQAVNDTDWLMGIVRPYYGTGNINETNITFEEIKLSIKLQKPRWFFIHRDVTFANKIQDKIQVNKKLAVNNEAAKTQITEKNKLLPNRHIKQEAIDLYNYVIKDHQKDLEMRNGNWAQEFYDASETLIYIQTQFLDYNFMKDLLKTNENGR